jgi:GT2 family glycosyltransferase
VSSAPDSAPRVGVSLVVFRSPVAEAARLLASLAAQEPARLTVRIRINAATDGSAFARAASQAGLRDVTVDADERNLGFSAAHNLQLAALFAAGCDHVLVVNPDVVLSPHAVALLVQQTDGGGPRLAGPLLELADEHGQAEGLVDSAGIRWTRSGRHLDAEQGGAVPTALGPPYPVAGLSGACLLVSRPAWVVLCAPDGEFFDEDFFAYREDADLALRAEALGVQSWLVPRALSLHGRRLRGTSRGGDRTIDRLGVRNRFLLALKHGRRRPGVLPLVLARDVVVVLGVLLVERRSLGALGEAWRLRATMRAKGRALREQAG